MRIYQKEGFDYNEIIYFEYVEDIALSEKILVLDIDGTLATSKKEISKETKKAILDVQERGHLVMLASGRPTPGMMNYAKELELEKYGGYLLSFNGAKIINCKTGEIVYQNLLPRHVIPSLYRFAKDNDCGLLTYFGDYIVLGTRSDEFVEIESNINQMPVRQVDDFTDFVDFDINKCLMTAAPEKAEKYVKILQEKYADVLSVYRSEPHFIEIMPKNVDKATSLDRMLQTVGLKREDAICCGDGYNDISMISYAGVGVAMKNAREEVKEAADYITPRTNDEDGLVDVIENFIL